MMTEERPYDVVCDLCDIGQAVSFCDECHSKVCTFCQALHIKQKQTRTHNLTIIEAVKLLVLRVKCSFCGGTAERFCSECNVRLCTKCAASHHKRCDIPGSPKQDIGDNTSDGHEIPAIYDASDQTTNRMENRDEGLSHDNSKILSENSMPQRSVTVAKDEHFQSDVLCDLCDEEIPACFCENCQKQLCALCQQGHTKQKQTRDHKLSAVENTKQSIPQVQCSSCIRHAEKVCNQCEVRFCTKCSDNHHFLSDTIMPRKQISNTEAEFGNRVIGRHLRPGSLVHRNDTMDKTSLPPESGSNQEGFHQVAEEECDVDGEVSGRSIKSKGPLAEDGSNTCVNYKRCQSMDKTSLPPESVSNQEGFHQVADEKCDVHGEVSGWFTKSKGPLAEDGSDKCVNYKRCQSMDKTSLPPESGSNQEGFHQVADEECDVDGEVSGRFTKSKGPLAEDGSDKFVNHKRRKSWGFRINRFNLFREGHDKHMKDNRPGKPFVKQVSSDSVDIEWDAVTGFCSGDVYQVLFESKQHKNWQWQDFNKNSGTIVGLKPNTPYTFKVRFKGKGNKYEYGEISEQVTTKMEDIQGKPVVQQVFLDGVDIIWKRVDSFCTGDVYEVCIKNIDTKKKIYQTFDINCATIEDLQPDSPYVFKVRLVKQNTEVSKYSEYSDRVKTCSTFASKLLHPRCQVKEIRCEGTALYELPMTEVQHATHADDRSIKYEIGPKGRDPIVEKTIMLLGATGTGKSTFVDRLANYVLGVRLEDPYRFTVTREEDREKQKNKAISQTDWITTYSFNPQEGTRLHYKLNVIDTPGVGDTRGPERDKEIISQIHKLLLAPGEKGVQTIDAVCFFVKAADCRLTNAQSSIFKAIQSFFGNDIKGNIYLVITFADGTDPAVMDAVRQSGLPYGEKFSFNNISLSSDTTESTTSMFWNMSLKSFRALFSHLETLETMSLQLTQEVLKQRHRLELTYQNLQSHINDKISIMKGIKEEMKIFQENNDAINKNKNFTYRVKELKVILVDLPRKERATNCSVCKTTCHRNCSDILESIPRTCWVINWITGKCSQCPKHCHWRNHKTTRFRYKTVKEVVEKTYADMQKRFQDASKKLLNVNEVLEKMSGQQESKFSEIMAILREMLECKNHLNKIALHPDQCSIKEQIDQLIEAERSEGTPGFQDRIKQLTHLLEEACLLEGSQNTAIRSDN